MPPILRNLGKILSSLRLTVALLGFTMVLIFIATLSQVHLGIHEVQSLYFRSWIAWWDVIPGEKSFSLPLPGGTLLGTLLIINLLAAHSARFKLRWNKAGMIVIHSGILIMLLSEILTGFLGKEAQMKIDEGETVNYSTFPREIELAVAAPDGSGLESVTSIPQSRLKNGSEFPFDSFVLKIRKFHPNADVIPLGKESGDFDPIRASEGIGKNYVVRRKPRETKMDRRDVSAAYVEISPNDSSEPIGLWLLSNALRGEQQFSVGEKVWKMSIRQKRLYHPFSIKLLDFSHDRYLGTNVPKNFSSTDSNHQSGDR